MDRDSNGLGAVTPPGTASPAPPAPPATRRAILAAALGGVAGAVASALGRAPDAQAAAGDPLILGQQNFAGNSATRLSATSSGGAFWMTQNGSGSGVRGESWNGTGGVFETHHPDRQGLLAQQLGTAGTGAALKAVGGTNTGLDASTDNGARYAVKGTTTSTAGNAVAVQGEVSSTAPGSFSTAVRGANKGTSGLGIGVWGSQDGSGFGVYGTAVGGPGVYGESESGYGVVAESDSGYGLYAISNSSYAIVADAPVRLNLHVDMPVFVEPEAPATSTARLFVRSSGGKVQLCVLFPTGAVQVLATEP